MKRNLVIISMIAVLCLVFVGCGGSTNTSSTTTPPPDFKTIAEKGAKVTEYSCDLKMSPSEIPGTTTDTIKLFVKGKSMRMEYADMDVSSFLPTATAPKDTMVLILNNDKKETYSIFLNNKMAMKSPMESADSGSAAVTQAGMLDTANNKELEGMKYVKDDTIDGQKAYVYGDDSGNIWMRADDGFILKIEFKENDKTKTMEFKNIKVGNQDASLFELPADVTLMQ